MNAVRFAGLLMIMMGTLAACSPDKPWMMENSTLIDQPMRLVESRHIIKKPLAALADQDVADAAALYQKSGAGPIYVVVAFKDDSKAGDHAAMQKASDIAGNLAARGVTQADIVSSTVPLQTDTPVALIAFDTLEAKGPEGCDKVPGLDTLAEADNMLEYKTGCGVKSMMARQVAYPADLEGVAGLGGEADGEHAANVLSEQYRPGTARDFLPSYIISELAGSGSE